IQFADLEECKREWLQTQQPLKRHDIYIMSKDEIPQYMKLYNIDVKFVSNTPSYNMYDYNIMNWYLKDPEPGLLGVYFTSRPNPFKSTYPNSDYKYTLNDLLKYELEISDAYVFWNANETNLNLPIIHHIVKIYTDQNNNTYKENLIQKDLFDNKITNNRIHVDLNCYNSTTNTGLSVPFDSNGAYFNYERVEAVYFDGGFRLENPNINFNNLKQLANGAKNIHVYSFNLISKEKEYIHYEDLDDPYTSIRNWKKGNGLFNDPKVVKKSDYNWEIIGDNFILTHTVETEDKIYYIKFTSNYNEKLIQWKNQCDIKPGRVYTAKEIRDRFGRSSRTIYDEHGRSINYRYVEGTFIDDWYIDGSECIGSNNHFNSYLDRLQTPTPPIKVNNNSINKPIKEDSTFLNKAIAISRYANPITLVLPDEAFKLENEKIGTSSINNGTLIFKQQELNDEKIVRPISENFKVKKINKKVKIYK
ncbi:hypothetical protein, partial [Candidatus Phytoplasma sp. AldY-WA1]|uniref:hypothetical protein n=1 Tax=Candidatus Phytoplasma sp. AldY-WA1 TaxID=2852100 RepID=UPI00254A5730